MNTLHCVCTLGVLYSVLYTHCVVNTDCTVNSKLTEQTTAHPLQCTAVQWKGTIIYNGDTAQTPRLPRPLTRVCDKMFCVCKNVSPLAKMYHHCLKPSEMEVALPSAEAISCTTLTYTISQTAPSRSPKALLVFLTGPCQKSHFSKQKQKVF